MRLMKRMGGVAALGALLILGTTGGASALNMQIVNSELWTRVRDCDLSGDTLAVALEYGVQLWDIGDEAQPVLLGKHYLDSFRAYALERHGDILAVTTLQKRLVILDVSDPGTPVELSVVDGIGTSPDVALHEVDGTLYACVGGNTDVDGLKIFDLGTPANPTVVGTADFSGLESIALAGETLFALAAGAGLYSLDISDLANPTPLDTILPGGSYANVSAQDTLAVVAANQAGFYVIDASDPANLAVLAQVSPHVNDELTMLRVKEVILDGALLYAITDFAGPLVYDLSDPANPLLVGYDPALDQGPPPPYVTCFDGDLLDQRLVVSHWNNEDAGVLIFDVAGLDPLLLGLAQTPDFTRYAGASASLVFGCNGESGIYGLGTNEDGELFRQGNLMLTEAYGVDAHGDLAYVASTSDGLVITDWSDAENPVILGNYDMGQARDVQVVGNLAYVAAFTQGIHVVDVADSTAPQPLDSANPGGASLRLDLNGALLASADQSLGMNLWDVSDPTDIVQLGNYPLVSRAADVLLIDGYAFVVEKGDSIHVVDISDPNAPQRAAVFHYDVAGSYEYDPQGLALVNGELIVASGGNGVISYDISDPLAPVRTDSLDTAGTAIAVFGREGRLVIADDSALLLASYGATAAPALPAASVALAAYPNPFNPHTQLRFELTAPARVALDIYDVNGRRLRRLAAGRRGAGTFQIAWDGRDDHDHELASGVYLARLQLDGQGTRLRGMEKLILIR